MREHEVPTHVQAEDKVLLWFTFPQIVAVVAVCAVAYGAFHYLPFGPMAVRLAVGALIGESWGSPPWWARWEAGGCPWWPPTS